MLLPGGREEVLGQEVPEVRTAKLLLLGQDGPVQNFMLSQEGLFSKILDVEGRRGGSEGSLYHY